MSRLLGLLSGGKSPMEHCSRRIDFWGTRHEYGPLTAYSYPPYHEHSICRCDMDYSAQDRNTTITLFTVRHRRKEVITDKEYESMPNGFIKTNFVNRLRERFMCDLYAYYVIGD